MILSLTEKEQWEHYIALRKFRAAFFDAFMRPIVRLAQWMAVRLK